VEKFGLVIIGAYNGLHILADLEKYKNSKILLVEPVPHNLKSLKERVNIYKNITFEESAIGNVNENKKFYFVKEESLPKLGKHWADAIGSLDKKHILDHKSKRFQINESDIEAVNVNCISFSTLVNKHSISEIEKLQIDVEGAEYQILDSIDYDKIKISKIIFEFKHFDGVFNDGNKLEMIKNKLLNHNYIIKQIDQENILAEKK
jgi:FkbM family methyltransferase